MFKPTETMDGLIDVTDQIQTSPEPETMLDSVFNETMTPEEEYTQALLVCSKPQMKINAYGTELTVKEGDCGIYAEGELKLTSRNNGCLAKWDELRISIIRRWSTNDEGVVTSEDYFSFRLKTFKHQTLDYWTHSSVMDFQRAFDKVLDMKTIIMKDVPDGEKLKQGRCWER